MSTDAEAARFVQQRREQLLRKLRTTGALVVSEEARSFGVAELTIRRDLNALAADGLVDRVHGGATLAKNRVATNSPRPPRPAAGRDLRIGIVVPQVDYYFPTILAGARAAAAESGARLLLRQSSYDVDDDRRSIEALAQTPHVDGIIAAPYLDAPESTALLRWMDQLELPIVLVEREPAIPLRRLEWVASDHASGAMQAVEHLTSQGHRRLAVIAQKPSPSATAIAHGFRAGIEAAGLDPAEQMVVIRDAFDGPDRHKDLSTQIAQFLDRGVTGLVVHNDPAAIALVNHCLDTGVRVPDDLAVVAYDDEVAALCDPPLSAVVPPKQHVGRLAVEMIVARLTEGHRRPPHRVSISPTLNVRESSVRAADQQQPTNVDPQRASTGA